MKIITNSLLLRPQPPLYLFETANLFFNFVKYLT